MIKTKENRMGCPSASAIGRFALVAAVLCAAAAKAAVALAVALFAVTTAEAARNWTGKESGKFQTSGNWSDTKGRRYFKDGNLTGYLITRIYLSGNVTESSNSGLCFDTPPTSSPTYWRFRSETKDTIYTYDNSGGKAYDTGILCVGYSGRSSKARFYAVNFNTRNFTIGGDPTYGGADIVQGNMTGYLILDDLDDDASSVWAPVNITAATCDFYNGDLYATNATITSSGNMTLYTFNAEKTGGDWTLNGDLIIGAKAGASATFTQNSGTVTVKDNKWTKSTSGNGTLNLNGGTFVTQHIEDEVAGGSLTVNINGGTLKANNVHSKGWITHGNGAGLNVNVGANGGTIDTNGRDISIHVAVNAVENTTGAFTVTGGGSATFSAMGNLAGALTVGDNTALHWFDQDGAVSATCGFTSLALGAGSTIYLDGDATGVDALPATATTTATTENKANLVINFSAIPATGASFTLFPAASADVFNVSPMFGSLVLPHEVAVIEGNLVLTIVAEDYIWNGTQRNWGDADAWTKGGAVATWSDGNNAILNTANATATLAADASPAKIDFTADATVNGTATLKVPVVDVASGVTATINAPIADTLVKAGTGTLVLGSSRTDETTVSEGTLAMAQGATVVPANLTLGSDSSTPVTFDYAGQTLVSILTTIVKPGANVTLTNIVVSNITENIYFAKDSAPSVVTVAKGAVLDFGRHYTLNTDNEATFNIAGGTAKTKANENNWLMQTSLSGRLNINVTDGGLMEFGGEVYLLTCRDAVDGSTDYQDPSLYFRLVDSTLRVLNTKSFRFGYDQYNKNPACPTGVFAATNSVIDIGYGISIGHNVVGDNKAGSYTADFENCVITTKVLRVYHDRPLNAIRLNNVRYTVNGDHADWLYSSPEFETMGAGGTAIKPITIDAGGLVLDTNGYNGDLQSDPQGAGAITKVGNGILHINRNQTSSSPLVCEGGETYVYDGLSVARAVTVRNGASFTTKGVGQVALANISFEAGAELRVDEYRSGIVPIAVTSLTLPASGTVTLTKNNNFSQGKYRILEKTGIAVADVQDKLVPATTDNLAYSWSVEGNTLVLTVGNPTGFAWTGFAGDGKMSTPGNWLGNVAPGAGDPADFSAVNVATTIEADIDATLGAVTMGSGIITFSGSLTASSFSDTSKVAVGANATVTFDGDLMFTGSGTKYVVYKVNAGGKFIVTGKVGLASGASGHLQAQDSPGTGIIVAGSLVNDSTDKWIYVAHDDNSIKQKWAIGPGGITGTCTSAGMWVYSNNKVNPEIQPNTNDFTVSLWTVLRESAKSFTYNTTGLDGLGHTITLDAGFSDKTAPLYVTGTGKVVVNHVTKSFGGKNAYSGPVTVTNSATLAINAGKKLTSGAITMNTGTTLEVAQSGDVTLDGKLTCAAGSTLKFNFTTGRTAPKLVLSQTPTFGEVKVSLSGVRPAYGTDGKHTIIEWPEGFDIGSVFTLADNQPKWVTGIAVEGDSLVLTSKPAGIMFVVK